MGNKQTKSNASALYTLITVFFFWGFLAASMEFLFLFARPIFISVNLSHN